MQTSLIRKFLQMKFDFWEVLFICIMRIIYVFWNIALDIFLKDEVMHHCDLFSQEKLNIENVLPLFKEISLICNHDS